MNINRKERTLYLECQSGISGDMTVAALLDLGATEEYIRNILGKLNVDGYELVFSRVQKCGIGAMDFNVILTDSGHEEGHHHHAHEHQPAEHGHHHTHSHEHRTWKDIRELLLGAQLPGKITQRACQMFEIVAQAEAKVHGKTVDDVHFHEVGAIDSIVDIVAAAACMEELEIDRILVSELHDGKGHVMCQHGSIPVPVPAVLEIIRTHGLVLRLTDEPKEMVTPTGAAIAALSEGKAPGAFKVLKTGIGAGKRELSHANILRAMLIEEV